MPDNFRNLCGVECGFGDGAAGGCRWRWRTTSNKIERRFDLVRQINCLPVTMDMHVENSRVVPEKVIVKRCHLQSVFKQSRHHGVDFFLSQNEIPHHDIVATVSFGHRKPATKSKRRW